MTGLTSRPYRGESDYDQMRELLIASFAISDPPVYCTVGCTVGDLDWWRWTANPGDGITNAHLWFDGDDLIAIAWPTPGQVDLLVHPNHRDVESLMLDWSYEHSLVGTVDDAAQSSLRVWAFDGDTERVGLFRERGFQRTDEALCFRQRKLDGSVPKPSLPDGYRIRHVVGEQDLERRVAVHRDAFAPSKMTVEKHRNVMQATTYRAELDLVVEAPDGTFAAYCLVWFDERNRLGLFEPVGCHSTHRRRGLTKAVMYEGMRRLRDLGANVAYVNSILGAEAASALYDSVGMQILDENHAWLKELD